jgi:hypothetical protein
LIAMMSSKYPVSTFRRRSRIPPESSWKMPTRLRLLEESVRIRIVERRGEPRSIASPVASCASSTACSSTVSVRSPRKSILRSPTRSSDFMSNWVVKSPFGRAVHRHVLGQGAGRDEHPRRVRRRVPREPFERHGAAEEPRVALVLYERLQLRHRLERALERHPEVGRDHLRDLVSFREGHPERARHVAHHRARRHRPEGDDLAHAVAAVLPDHVVDDLLPVLVREVDVDIRHAHALRIQEALEEEVELDRIDVGDAERVGDEAPAAEPRPGPRPRRSRARSG